MPTNREQFLKKNNIPLSESLSLEDISKVGKIPIKALKEVYSRGLGAAKTQPGSIRLLKDFSKNPDINKFPRSARLSAPMWAMGRTYAFSNKSDKVYYGADDDIRRKYKLK
jgi:hypothetical protein